MNLGNWVRSPNSWFYNPREDRLYRHKNGKYASFQRATYKQSRSLQVLFGTENPEEKIPENVHPATVHAQGNYWAMTGHSPLVLQTTASSRTFMEFIESRFSASERWVFSSFEIIGNWADWNSEVSLCAVSDGSYKDHHGTAAFIITDGKDHVIQGQVVTPGLPSDQNAYRSELAGIYAIVLFLHEVTAFFSISPGSIEVACDGMSALRQVQFPSEITNSSRPHFDLITATRHIVSLSPWNWTWRHVMGHQDSQDKVLDKWESWNVQMDTAAKAYWTTTHNMTNPVATIRGEPWRVQAGGRKISSDLHNNLITFCTAKRAQSYWHKKRDGLEDVDWSSIGGAIRQLKWNRRIWITKQVTGFSATGINMVRRKERSDPRCPCCPDTETAEHLWKCQSEGAADVWKTALRKLHTWLLQNDTHPGMADSIVEYLEAWRTDSLPATRSLQPWMLPAFQQQDTMGWRAFSEGILGRQWVLVQQHYLARIQSRRSSRCWVTSLILKLWDVAWDLWEHRNGVLHDKNMSILLTELHRDIVNQYRTGAHGLDKDTRALFSTPLPDLLTRPYDVKKQWLNRVLLARQRCTNISSSGHTYSKERDLMHRWLQNK